MKPIKVENLDGLKIGEISHPHTLRYVTDFDFKIIVSGTDGHTRLSQLTQKSSRDRYLESIDYDIEKRIRDLLTTVGERIQNKYGNKRKGDDYLDSAFKQLELIRNRLSDKIFNISDAINLVGNLESDQERQILSEIIQLAFNQGRRYQNSRSDEIESELTHFRDLVDQRSKHTKKWSTTACQTIKTNADIAAKALMPVLKELETDGKTSLREIAAELNARQTPCLRGGSQWYPATVKLLKDRLNKLNIKNESNQSNSI